MKKRFVLGMLVVGTLAISACGKDASSTEQGSETVDGVTEVVSQTEGLDETESTETTEDATYVEDNSEWEKYEKAISQLMLGYETRENYVPNGNTPQEIVDVLLGTGKFLNTDEDNKSIYLSELKRYQYDMVFDFKPSGFELVDLDLDGYNELLVSGSPQSMEIFHYEDGVVYGFEFNYRATADVKSNGILVGNSGASSGNYYRLDFYKDTYEETYIGDFTGLSKGQSSTLFGVAVEEFVYHYWFSTQYIPCYSNFEDIKGIVEREKTYAKEAEEYIKSKEVSQAIIDILLYNAEFTDTTEDSKKVSLSEFQKFGQKFKVQKYTIADVDEDGVNDVIVYWGEVTALATVFTNGKDGVNAHTTFASSIMAINPDGVCYGNGESYYYDAVDGHIVWESNMCKIETEIVDDEIKKTYLIRYDEVTPKEYYEYYTSLWGKKIPFCKDLSLLAQ